MVLLLSSDHPRVCGEKHSLCDNVLEPVGSPPRMRGKDYRDIQSKQAGGITPAYAGKRSAGAEGVVFDGDHPRVCGEKVVDVVVGPVEKGSPPRMRGKEWFRLS